MDALAPLLPLLPKLLQGNSEEVIERIENMQKSDVAPLRDQVQILRKQCYRMLKAQEQLLEKVHEIQRQQVAAAGAVLDLAQQMARITFVEDPPAGDDVDELDARTAPAARHRTKANGSGKRQRES